MGLMSLAQLVVQLYYIYVRSWDLNCDLTTKLLNEKKKMGSVHTSICGHKSIFILLLKSQHKTGYNHSKKAKNVFKWFDTVHKVHKAFWSIRKVSRNRIFTLTTPPTRTQLDLWNYLNTLCRFARGAGLTWAYTQSREGSSKDSININNVSIGFVWPIAPFIACHSLVNSIIKKVIFCHFMLCIKLITAKNKIK
jgi:hypothetical protein